MPGSDSLTSVRGLSRTFGRRFERIVFRALHEVSGAGARDLLARRSAGIALGISCLGRIAF